RGNGSFSFTPHEQQAAKVVSHLALPCLGPTLDGVSPPFSSSRQGIPSDRARRQAMRAPMRPPTIFLPGQPMRSFSAPERIGNSSFANSAKIASLLVARSLARQGRAPAFFSVGSEGFFFRPRSR